MFKFLYSMPCAKSYMHNHIQTTFILLVSLQACLRMIEGLGSWFVDIVRGTGRGCNQPISKPSPRAPEWMPSKVEMRRKSRHSRPRGSIWTRPIKQNVRTTQSRWPCIKYTRSTTSKKSLSLIEAKPATLNAMSFKTRPQIPNTSCHIKYDSWP